MPNKSYAYLLHVEPSNLVFLKTFSTEFDEIIIKLMKQQFLLLIFTSAELIIDWCLK